MKKWLKILIALISILVILTVVGFYKNQREREIEKDMEGRTIFSLHYKWLGLFISDERYYSISYSKGKYYSQDGKIINSETIETFCKSFSSLREGEGELNITHTDEYPFFRIDLYCRGKAMRIWSVSDGYKHVPWNVNYDGKIYSQYNGLIWDNLLPLLCELDPDWCKDLQQSEHPPKISSCMC